MTTILESHMQTPVEKRDLDWVRQSLNTALSLECATLPLYLSAMFSLEVQNYTTYNLIRSIVMEEMVHMAIAANMLAALGGAPRLKDMDLSYPSQGLPGGAEPDLYVGIAQLSKRQLKSFMRIEMPAFLLPKKYKKEKYPTISALYGAIKSALQDNADAARAAVKAGSKANQVGDNIGFTTFTYDPKVDPLKQLVAGIDEILEQGEGASSGNLFAGEGSEDEESHFGKFAEIYYGHRYEAPKKAVEMTRDNLEEFFTGRPIPWPVVMNTLAVPADGYAKVLALDPNASKVEHDLTVFDNAFSDILAKLDDAWNGPADTMWPTLGKAVDTMTSLRVLSCFNIVRYQVPGDAVGRLAELYPDEIERIKSHTDLKKPVFYGPRFVNTNRTQKSSA